MDTQGVQSLPNDFPKNGTESRPIIHIATKLKHLVVVERREFVRGCLTSWLETSCREFNLSSVADVTAPLSATALAQAVVVVFHANSLVLADDWLDGQLAWLRVNQPDVPIVAIVEADRLQPIAGLVARLRLQGYIPTSSSMEVAAAVLRLVAAGGTYIPHTQDESPPPVAVEPIHQTSKASRIAGLTPRECGVLELLQRGMSNKIIAYRLSLSQSTVKAHVHNIICKLKVHNRTEAAVASHHSEQVSAN